MQIKATTVDMYLEEVPVDRLTALQALRALCKKHLKGYEELMAYGLPCYKKNNVIEVAFASQKNFIGLYILKQAVMDKYKNELTLSGISLGKGCIRYSKPNKINFDIVSKMLHDIFVTDGPVC